MRCAALRAAARIAAAGSCLLAFLAGTACGPRRPLTPPDAYHRYCARCHGDDGLGDPKAVRLNPKLDLVRSEMVRDGDLARVRERIENGRGAMPALKHKLSPEEIEALTAYTVERFGSGGG